MDNRAKSLSKLIRGPNILLMPGVFDGYSARLTERYGFKAGFISGAGVSEAQLGQPDIGLMGLEVNLFTSRMLAACCSIPLLGDADTGYGNAVNVYHAVRAFEQAGLAGLMIEDQTWPKRCGHMRGKSVIDAGEMVEKIRAAADARRDRHFVIKARTDAAATHGIREAIRRLNLYGEAGADLVFADALLTEKDIRTVAANVSRPLSVNMGFGLRRRLTTPLISPPRLQELGVAVAIYPRMLTACAVQAMKQGLETLRSAARTRNVIERPDLAVSFEELNDLIGFREHTALETRYATKPVRKR